MKKVISILVSVMMILTAIPAFAATEAPYEDSHAALDNFSEVDLAKTFTNESRYVTSDGLEAPYSDNALNVTLHEDDEEGDYLRVHTVTDDINPKGGVRIINENLNVGFGETKNNQMTFNTKIRATSASTTQGNIYFYLIGTDKSITTIAKWWRTGHKRLYFGTSSNYNFSMENDVWYDLDLSIDFSKQEYKVRIDGGAFDNYIYKSTKTIIASNSKTYIGFGVGYQDNTIKAGDYFDIANMSIETVAFSDSYDSTMDESTIENCTQGWTQGAWLGEKHDKWTTRLAIENVGGTKGDTIKFSKGAGEHFYIAHTLPDKTVESDGILIVEGSTYDEYYSQFNVELTGTSGGGSSVVPVITNASSQSWNVAVFGDYADDNGKIIVRPQRGEKGWVRTRVIFNLKTDDVIFQQWDEADPVNTLITATRLDAIETFTDITKVRFGLYTNWGSMWLDNLRVYTADTLRYTGSYPVDTGANGVSVTADPSLIFNMPVENYTGTMTLKDSDGNAVAGTVGINAQRNGIAFYPTSDLKGEETYTLTANCAVTDVFGSAMNVAKTITFTTEPVLTLVDFEFSSDEVVAGELGATIEVKSKDKLPKNIYAALAIYNKSTGELVSINTGSINAVTNTFNLTAEVPELGEYYAKAFVWNTDANAVPYFTAQSIGLN